jgi:circadian clock protein KaiB
VKTSTTARKARVARKAGAARKSRLTRDFERAISATPTRKIILRLYVAGATEMSRQAVMRARQLCETELKGNFELQVVDVYQQPMLARDGQILATPTLVREFPRPVRRLIGNLSNTVGLLVGLDMVSRGKIGR